MAKVLLIEDNSDFAAHVKTWLESSSHRVEVADTAQEAADMLVISEFDVLILDWELPDGAGPDICRRYRKQGGKTPILFLTGKARLEEKEIGFLSGADDYLTKPCELRELELRVQALARRPSALVANVVKRGALEIDLVSRQVKKNGKLIPMPPREFDLLEFLSRYPDQFFTADQLITRVWNSDTEVTLQAVAQCIKRLREKIDDPQVDSFIVTRRGIGYGLRSL